VVVSHDPVGSVAEADVVLGLKRGRAELVAEARSVGEVELRGLYR